MIPGIQKISWTYTRQRQIVAHAPRNARGIRHRPLLETTWESVAATFLQAPARAVRAAAAGKPMAHAAGEARRAVRGGRSRRLRRTADRHAAVAEARSAGRGGKQARRRRQSRHAERARREPRWLHHPAEHSRHARGQPVDVPGPALPAAAGPAGAWRGCHRSERPGGASDQARCRQPGGSRPAWQAEARQPQLCDLWRRSSPHIYGALLLKAANSRQSPFPTRAARRPAAM